MRFLICIICISSLVLSCSKEADEPVESGDASYKALRKKVIQKIVSQTEPRFETFETNLETLEKATLAWKTSLDAADLQTSKDAFRATILSWEEIEATLHVPIDMDDMWTITRDDIYSWPLSNRCRVDQELAKKAYENSDDFANLLVNAKGLDAIEYLLWHLEENECPPQSTLNSSGEWAAISDLDERRAAYALATVQLVKSDTITLKKSAISLGESVVDANTSEALNTLSNSLYYLDINVKDLKIAHPLGLQDCATADCFDDVELPLSELSSSAVNRNLVAFDQMFFGEPGFDDLLEASDSKEIAADIRVALDTALALSSEKETLKELEADEKATQLLAAIKAITDRLKTDFIGVLDLELPQRAEGDND